MQKSTFLKKNGFGRGFNKIEELVVTNVSTRHIKHQTIAILLMVDSYAFFRILHFF